MERRWSQKWERAAETPMAGGGRLAARRRGKSFDPTSANPQQAPYQHSKTMSTYKLLGHHGSTCARAVIATCVEVGAGYDLQTIDLTKAEHKSADFLKQHQPFGQVPVLYDGEYRLFESRAIMRYLASKHKADALYPTDLKQRGLVEQWLSVNQSNEGPIVAIVSEFFFSPFLTGSTPDQAKVPDFKAKLNALLDILEAQLSKTSYLAGDKFTLADLSFLPYMQYLLQCAGFEKSFDGHAKVKAWWTACSARDSWKKATSHGFGY